MGKGVKGTLGLLEHKGAIPLFLLIYSFIKYLFCPFYVPGTAGKESEREAKWMKHKIVNRCQSVTSDT